jgi:eukaryotic-like serine/threonine-protein kinase
MGEVYRARDTKLDRAVAIKILPESFAQDAERLARFAREAKTLAALNHPNIAIIHGFEDDNGIQGLVMELVEGSTLADRIAQGPIPIDEALPIARQIADTLEAAHNQSIIHRDLKPANIKLRPDGTVKVLDFGLAKALSGDESGSGARPLSLSPTITSPGAMTGIGVILGTAAYMAPEQARGKTIDKRADIWAFGCVLYEMLTGRQAFEGAEVTDVLARIIEREIPDDEERRFIGSDTVCITHCRRAELVRGTEAPGADQLRLREARERGQLRLREARERGQVTKREFWRRHRDS